MAKFHLAQVNVAHLIAPLGDSRVAEFFDKLPRINTLAESSEGFVWRYTDDYPDPAVAFNLSVWESLEYLSNFVYRSEHIEVFRRRDNWMTPMTTAHLAMWWVTPGHRPSVEESLGKLALLNQRGPSPNAFTFKDRFDPPLE